MTDFIQKWQDSESNERANYQSFLNDFCEFLGVEKSPPKGEGNHHYCFDRDVKIIAPSGAVTTNFIDFYKEGCFVLETKQGSNKGNKGHGKRGTATYRKEMKKAFGQALKYARFVELKPPFLITCDIGDHFRVWQDFSESWLSANGNYGTYDSVQKIPFADLKNDDVKAFFYKIFSDPQSLNPEKIAAQVTREVAADLAELAIALEQTAEPQAVAQFLMRCIFTMFAEDVGLLKEQLFTDALKSRWILNPQDFKSQVESLWAAMNDGTSFGFHGQLLRFNGGLFAKPQAIALTADQLQILLTAAERDWRNVEPAIFGTLLERALEKKERSKLGAHYTPRAYVERLVRPVIIEPLQEKWQLIQGEVETFLELREEILSRPESPEKKGALTKNLNETTGILNTFLKELREIKVLDPACGSGNFLYVTMDLMKTLELEVLNRLGTVIGSSQLKLGFDQVNPSQFLGIEINPRAAEIADLVIWIGYLQWHFRLFGSLPPVEPVLQEYKNIENRDAVLDYDGTKPAIDPKTGKGRSRWGGRTMKHSVTGEDVPDPSDQVEILEYINPREAQWQQANYIVSNPPFLGNARMREYLGDGYAETLRKVYKDVPDTVDFVMYWWHKAAQLVSKKNIFRFGLITTNTISQIRQRSVLDVFSDVNIEFAIPDHPWTDKGAAVRIAMTVASHINSSLSVFMRLGKVTHEINTEIPEESANSLKISWQKADHIFSNLQSGTNLSKAQKLKSNINLCSRGFELGGRGFILDGVIAQEWLSKNPNLARYVKPYVAGKELVNSNSKNQYVIDFYGVSEIDVEKYILPYQYLIERVKPVRQINQESARKKKWWLFRRSGSMIRPALSSLERFIVSVHTAKHRVFIFLEREISPDATLVLFALSDAYFIGLLSSYIHILWSLAMGGRLGIGNDPRYNQSKCFDPFPFPDLSEELKQEIRELGERLDSHRKQVQADHPEVTITAMYNCLEKMRSGEPFTDGDREFNNKALISTLKQIHDDLDQAVFRAYGWEDLIPLWQQVYRDPPQPPLSKGGEENLQKVPLDKGDLGGSIRDLGGSDLKEQLEQSILQRLVDFNAERAEEERNGLVRWLRPEYQAPDEIRTQKVIEGLGVEEKTEAAIAPPEQQKFPTKLKDQLAVIRDLLRTQGSEWTETQIAAQFKGAAKKKEKAIPMCLEILEDLGAILSIENTQPKRYYAAELQNIA